MVFHFDPHPADVSAQPTPNAGGQIFPSLAITKASNIGQVVAASLQAHVTCGGTDIRRFPEDLGNFWIISWCLLKVGELTGGFQLSNIWIVF